MKNTLQFLLLSLLVTSILISACGSNKKLKASKARVEQLKRDSIETHRKLNEKNTVVVKKDVPIVTTEPTTKNTTPVETKPKAEVYIPLPPVNIEKIFKTKYPAATEVVWTKEVPFIKVEDKNKRDYKVIFLLEDNKNSAIYSENGELIEIRLQILPDQLPPNIYNAIKNKFPNVHIIYAATVKNSKTKGSYIALIRSQSQPEEREVILMENGTFLE